MRFSGSSVIVTGAARGIGAATAKAFAKEGARVVVNDLASADGVVEEIRAAGGRAEFVQADVADYPQVEKLVSRAVELHGRLDVMVANAAFSERAKFWETSAEGFRRTIDVTMFGAYHCLLAATKQMIAQGAGGSIVVTGSPHADFAFPGSMGYNMAKAAVTHMAKSAAVELFDHKIRVNVLHPGWTNTPGERKFFTEEDLARIGQRIPPGRLAHPEEIARGILFLAEPDSIYINGTTLMIDGGLNLPWQDV
jgi:glucose 1-dehydrogenase